MCHAVRNIYAVLGGVGRPINAPRVNNRKTKLRLWGFFTRTLRNHCLLCSTTNPPTRHPSRLNPHHTPFFTSREKKKQPTTTPLAIIQFARKKTTPKLTGRWNLNHHPKSSTTKTIFLRFIIELYIHHSLENSEIWKWSTYTSINSSFSIHCFEWEEKNITFG